MLGEIPGVPIGTQYQSRLQLARAGVHRFTQAGISWSKDHPFAESIVASGGYEDDEDHGDWMLYTGEGGRDPNRGKQVSNQELSRGNLALVRSHKEGSPVRVIRRDAAVYRYDGLWRVDEVSRIVGRSGHWVFRFRLVATEAAAPGVAVSLPTGTTEPERRGSWTQRIVRQTSVSLSVKRIHDFACQICGTKLLLPSGPYAEAAHIRPLGRPHDGPDIAVNVLCLCPNCHVLFDAWAITIADNLDLIGRPGKLTVRPDHPISIAHVKYHRESRPTSASP